MTHASRGRTNRMVCRFHIPCVAFTHASRATPRHSPDIQSSTMRQSTATQIIGRREESARVLRTTHYTKKVKKLITAKRLVHHGADIKFLQARPPRDHSTTAYESHGPACTTV